MTQAELLKRILAGEILAVGEYRGGEAKNANMRDAETGRTRSFVAVKHNIEFGNMAVGVSERVPDDYDVTKFVQPVKKGQPVVVRLNGLKQEKGVYKASGIIEPLTT